MRPIAELDEGGASGLRFVLTDIDDTLTRDGYLEAAPYAALWRLRDSGLTVIPVTGRPAGWCDLIIREWPVEAVIGENGAFVYYRNGSHIATLTHPSVASEDVRRRLDEVRRAVLAEIPGTRVARDQFARIYDLAIDFREDPPFLSVEEAEKIKLVCERFGAQAKISSIHVNTWFGSYDKLDMARRFLAERYGLDDRGMQAAVLFCGDSPNDEPMFRFFPLSCAVANIASYAHLIASPPGYIASAAHGAGFAEIVEIVLGMRKKTIASR